ncbi:MAG: nucleotidyl transferase AbiEii/AbiGii toxin family protein [Bacteroidales bacterium]
MINRREINIESLIEVAEALGDLNDRAVYVGGAVVSLYVNDPAAEDPRPTKDIDVAMEIATVGELEKVRQQLAEKGFHNDPQEKVICRFTYENILVDVMSTQEVGWAPANPWFKDGFEHLEVVSLNERINIRIMPLAYFLAAKFEAFHGRGKDPRTSHDFEDIIFVMDNRTDLVEQTVNAPEKVRNYLKSELEKLLKLEEAVLGHLNPFTQKERYEILKEKTEAIIKTNP